MRLHRPCNVSMYFVLTNPTCVKHKPSLSSLACSSLLHIRVGVAASTSTPTVRVGDVLESQSWGTRTHCRRLSYLWKCLRHRLFSFCGAECPKKLRPQITARGTREHRCWSAWNNLVLFKKQKTLKSYNLKR